MILIRSFTLFLSPPTGMMYRPSASSTQPQMLLPTTYQIAGNQIYQVSIRVWTHAKHSLLSCIPFQSYMLLNDVWRLTFITICHEWCAQTVSCKCFLLYSIYIYGFTYPHKNIIRTLTYKRLLFICDLLHDLHSCNVLMPLNLLLWWPEIDTVTVFIMCLEGYDWYF
jgi:hypothetical protein